MTNLEDFVTHVGKIEEIEKLSKRDSRTQNDENKKKKLRELSYETLMQYRDILEGEGYDFTDLTPDALKEQRNKELYEKGINMRQIEADRGSANILISNLNEVLNDIKPGSLEELALTKPLMEAAQNSYSDLVNEYREVLENYGEYFQKKNIVDRYKKGEGLNQQEQQLLYATVAESAGDKLKEKLKEKGYTEEEQGIGRDIAFLTAREGYIKRETVIKNSDALVKKAEEKFRKYEEEKGKKIKDYVSQVLDKLVKDEDAERFGLARSLIYTTTKKE